MSTTERKARKRAGIRLEKAAKEATPFFDREDFKRKSEKKQDEIAAAHGRTLTPQIKDLLAMLRPPKAHRQVRNYTR